ncbi:Fibrillin-3-like isoform X30 [Oopsacas minuta]|uniref:Fibrillin-3-like isoform X30 n=1 Tax=Oopsacas minuta TaxID=111878 RepID=A0AAV7KCC3_9METZ|nr:Fibrillin-3-like isoform X30 [Oopsacas minuta]
MTNICIFLHLLVVFVLLETSTVLSSCEDNNYCYEYSSGVLYCHGHPINSTVFGNVLTSCTVGEHYHELYLEIYFTENFELRLNLSDNITTLTIDMYWSEIYINPLRQHTNITELQLGYHRYNWETRDNKLSTYFPNLQIIRIEDGRSINIIDSNLLSDLMFLSSLTWRFSSLVNISVDAFRGLSSLSFIDISYNSISYLSSETFQHLPSLRELIVYGGQLNCTCQLQWMSIVDANGWIDIIGSCEGSGLSIDSPSTYSQCHSTESYQCFNKSVSCDNVCINTADSYICACTEGYGLTLIEAEQACHDIDECVQNVTICQEQNCRNTLGSYQCYCSEGFLVSNDGNTCSDVNECSNNPCEHNCTNTMGSYLCSCYEHFILSNDRHTCQCQSGYKLTADGCVDIDECIDGNGGCDDICINTDGSYTCGCYLNQSNPVPSITLVFIVTTIFLTIIVIALVIALIITCCWKGRNKSIEKTTEAKDNREYTTLQVPEPTTEQKSQPGYYTYIDEEKIRDVLKPATYPAVVKNITLKHGSETAKKSEHYESHYMNLSDY